MTNPNRSDITILLDRSGSMESLKHDVEGGFAALLAEQRKLPGECALSLVQFDSQAIEALYTAVPIKWAPELRLVPRGSTPLLDAVGSTIVKTGERFAALSEAERPGRVLFVIITDGLENASKEYGKAEVRALVERQRRDYRWEFLYLGANVDAFAEAGAMGIARECAAAYEPTPSGAHHVFAVASAKLASHRRGAGIAFTEKERKNLKS